MSSTTTSTAGGIMLVAGLCCAGCELDKASSGADTFESTCGNKSLELGEDCDGELFRISKCHNGTLVCLPGCLMDKAACTRYCGDDVLDPAEECDTTNFKVPCLKGTLKCGKDCTVDRSGCQSWCGDGKIDSPKEQCDGKVIPAGVCHNGTVKCTEDCSLDFHDCDEFCGDEVINGSEECDRTQFHYPCHDSSGVLVCREDCAIDPGGCTKYCGDGVLNHVDEDCDRTAFKAAKPCAQATCRTDCTVNDTACP